jgi:hypothetical protein
VPARATRAGRLGRLARSRGHEKELFGGEALTTNNRMELTAVIEALASLKRSCDVTLYTDSEYVRKGITEWIHGWKQRGWKTADKKPVKNADLWQRLDALPRCTASTGTGCGATRATPATSARTRSPTAARRASADAAAAPAASLHRLDLGLGDGAVGAALQVGVERVDVLLDGRVLTEARHALFEAAVG